MPLHEHQADALSALNWLYSMAPDLRRSGRSYVWAVHYLYQAVEVALYAPRWSEGWVKIVDHCNNSNSNHCLYTEVCKLVGELDLQRWVEFQSAARGKYLRIVETETAASHVSSVLNNCFGPLSFDLSNGVVEAIQGELDDKFPHLPRTTVWDLLKRDDDD